jgi:hypothetical protein
MSVKDVWLKKMTLFSNAIQVEVSSRQLFVGKDRFRFKSKLVTWSQVGFQVRLVHRFKLTIGLNVRS